MVEKQSEAFHTFLWHFFPSLKQNIIAYRSSKVSSCPDCIFEIHQLWQSGFSMVYFSSCCSCSFEPEIKKKNGQSSYKMYSNNIVNFQVSTTIRNACTKKVWKHIYMYVCMCVCVCVCVCVSVCNFWMNSLSVSLFWKELLEHICWNTFKWFQVLLFNANNSM